MRSDRITKHKVLWRHKDHHTSTMRVLRRLTCCILEAIRCMSQSKNMGQSLTATSFADPVK